MKISNQLRNLIANSAGTNKKTIKAKYKTPNRRKQTSLSTLPFTKKKRSDRSLKITPKGGNRPRSTKELLKNMSNFQNMRRKKNMSFIQRVKVRKPGRSRTKTKSFAYPSRSGNKENSAIINDTLSNKSLFSEVSGNPDGPIRTSNALRAS